MAYAVTKPGQYEMAVLVNKQPIAESPFDVEVGVGEAFGAKCKASGDGLRRANEREEAAFEVETFDEYGNKVPTGGARVTAAASCKEEEVMAHIIDNRDGTYTGHYTPTHFGEYKLKISVTDGAVSGSPFAVKVDAAPVSPPQCTASGEGIHKAEPSTEAHFEVETRTMYGRIQSLPKVGELSAEFVLMIPALRPQLGMEVEKHAREPAKGLRVIKVAQVGAAATARIQVGDYIQSFKGQGVRPSATAVTAASPLLHRLSVGNTP